MEKRVEDMSKKQVDRGVRREDVCLGFCSEATGITGGRRRRERMNEEREEGERVNPRNGDDEEIEVQVGRGKKKKPRRKLSVGKARGAKKLEKGSDDGFNHL